MLARVLTPVFWRFIEHAVGRDEQWAIALRDRLLERCGRVTPERDVVTLTRDQAPAVAEWLAQGHPLTIRDVLRRPDDRDELLPVAALALLRDGETVFTPGEDTLLRSGDEILLVGKPWGLAHVAEICHYPTTVEYLATGLEVPSTWVWRQLTARRRAAV